MKLIELFEETKAEQIDRAHAALQLTLSDAELSARDTEFEKHYPVSDDWYFFKDELLHIVSDLRSTTMWAACFHDVIKKNSDLPKFFLEKVFPILKKAGFPKVRTEEMMKALNRQTLTAAVLGK